jgi:hypothetical protein
MLDEPTTVMGAMYGHHGFRIGLNPEKGTADPVEPIFIPGKGKMIRKNTVQNKRIAAIVTVTEHNLWNHAMKKYINTENGRTRRERADDVLRPDEFGLPDFDDVIPGVTVWENAVASKKLPKDLFSGSMDAWWEVTPDFRQLPAFIGDLRRDLEVDKCAMQKMGLWL